MWRAGSNRPSSIAAATAQSGSLRWPQSRNRQSAASIVTSAYAAWRKLQAEAHRQLVRVDARARAAEKSRLRSFHRAIREQPNRMR